MTFDFDDDLSKSLESNKLEVIEGLAKPPSKQDLEYFVSVGFLGKRDNPYRLKEHKHVPITEIVKVFRKFSYCIGYRYKDCCDPIFRETIEKIWMIHYSKD